MISVGGGTEDPQARADADAALSGLSGVDARLDIIEPELSNLEQDVNSGLSGQDARLDALEADVSGIQLWRSGISGNVAGLQATVSDLQAGQSGLSGAVAGLQADTDLTRIEFPHDCIARQGTPPGSWSDGDRYLVDNPAAGDWAGNEGGIAVGILGGTAWGYEWPSDGAICKADGVPYCLDAAALEWREMPRDNQVPILDGDGRVPAADMPAGVDTFWIGPRPVGLVTATHIRTNTNGEAGTWATPTLPGAVFPALTTGAAFYVLMDVQNPAGIIMPVNVAGSGGTWALQYWNGATWAARGHMAAEIGGTFSARGENSLANVETQVVFLSQVADAAAKNLDGLTGMWIRWIVTAPIAASPEIQSVSRAFDSVWQYSGVNVYFGARQPVHVDDLPLPLWINQNGVSPGNRANQLSVNIEPDTLKNVFADGAIDAFCQTFRVDEATCTACTADFAFLWYPVTAATAPNNIAQLRGYISRMEEDVTLINGTDTDTLAAALVTVPAVARRLTETDYPIAQNGALPDSYINLKVERDARVSNANDTYNGDVAVVMGYYKTRRWRD